MKLPLGPENLGIHGHFKWTTRDAATGQIHDEMEADNLITTNGLSYLMYAFVNAVVANQNLGWGTPIPTSYANLGNTWGAVGVSSTAAAASDLALGHEISRALITNAGVVSSNSVELDFFFGTSSGNGTITEGGVFFQAVNDSTVLTSQLTASSTYTTLSVSPFLILDRFGFATTLPTGSFLLIGYGSSGSTQYCKTTSPTVTGATSIGISAPAGGTFTANATYPVGTTVEFGPNGSGQPNPAVNGGILFDHVIFGASSTKNSTETATLGLQLTFTSA